MADYPVDPARLGALKATRGGRVSLAGFEYQRAFAILRLTALVLQRPVRGCLEVPAWIRYEWAEDIDELSTAGDTVLWQCKHGEGWTHASRLADVLLGFAPKWLWSPPERRGSLAFRLVTSDREYAANHDLPGPLPSMGAVRAVFLGALGAKPSDRSDRALWQQEADAAGHAALFDALWKATRVLYVPGTTTAEGVWDAERAAVDELARARKVADPRRAGDVVAALRALLSVHQPGPADAAGTVARLDLPPASVRAVDVEHRLFPFAREDGGGPMQIVDRTRLLQVLQEPVGQPFVARRPEWPDVVRGANQDVRFFERKSTDRLVESLRAALADATSRQGKLRIQWLVGAPGAGKSALALRAAARLVLDGACVVADARYQIGEDDAMEAWLETLQRLAAGPVPVLLLLDDPLGAGSTWARLLSKLGRNNPAIVVLAATPDFLLDRHRGDLRDVHFLPAVPVERPDREERDALARLYPDAAHRLRAGDDEELIVLAMQAAANASFDEIIQKIWNTLADQQQLAGDVLGSALRWEQVAFSIVSFFHRVYVPCPMLLLEKVLTSRADIGADAVERLKQLELRQGWRILQVQAASERWSYQGGSLATMHSRVAQRAWDLRPAPGWDLAAVVARASVLVPQVARPLARWLVELHERRAPDADRALSAVIAEWTGPTGGGLETRYLADLTSLLSLGGIQIPAALRKDLLRRAQLNDAQSWLAALQLFYASAPERRRMAFPEGLQLGAIVGAADFSLAPNRSSQLYNALERRPELLELFERRVWLAFDGKLPWSVDSFLLTWLLSKGKPEEKRGRLDVIRAWLRERPGAQDVRVRFIGVLTELEVTDLTADVEDLRRWLREHPDDRHVRSRFVGLLEELGLDGRADDVEDLRAWLREHPDDEQVRARFIRLIPALGAGDIEELRKWLRAHPDDRQVRVSFIALFPQLGATDRAAAIEDVRAWLRERDDVTVRQTFLSYLAAHPSEAVPGDLEAALSWVLPRPTERSVRSSLLRLLAAHKHPARADLIAQTLELPPTDSRSFQPVSAALRAAGSLPPDRVDLIVRCLKWAVSALESHAGNPSASLIAEAVSEPIRALGQHLAQAALSKEARAEAEAVLRTVAESRERWLLSVNKPGKPAV